MEKNPVVLLFLAFLAAVKPCLTSQVADEVRSSFLSNELLLYICITL